MILNREQLVKNLVCKVRSQPSRPHGWNDEGQMDEYVDRHVIISRPPSYCIDCNPLFNSEFGNGWAWNDDDFVKANTIQKLPDWIKVPIEEFE